MKKRSVVIFLIIVAAFAVYAPALRDGFVWDDTALVFRDPFIRSWRLLAEGFRHFLFTDATASDFYRPLQRVTYTWDYAWFALRPAGWHLTNIALHAGAAVMLFLFLEQWLGACAARRAVRCGAARETAEKSVAECVEETPRDPLAALCCIAGDVLLPALVALLWVIHPLHSSAVIYVSGRADLLAALFGFAGLYLSLRRSGAATLGAAVCFFAAVLSKESGIVFLVLAVVLTLFNKEKPWRWLAVGMCVLGAYGALRLTAEHQAPPPPTEVVAPAARPIVAARAWAEYAGLFLAPLTLHMERTVLPFQRGDTAETLRAAGRREYQTLLGLLLLIAFVIWMRWARTSLPSAFASLVAFLIAYLPISNLLPLNATVAEHWLYVPSAFLLTAAALSVTRLRLSLGVKATLVVLWAVLLGTRTFTRNADWRDARTFFEHTIADGGNSARMLMNLGGLESAEGHQRYAIGHFTNALKLVPDQPVALLGLGSVYLRSGDFPKAREQFEKALANPFVRAEAIQDLAILEYKESGKDRVDLLREAAESAPENWAIQRRYIGHLEERGDLKPAISALQKLLLTQWWRAESWHILGDFWTRAGQTDSAERAYGRAVQYDVHDDAAAARLEELTR